MLDVAPDGKVTAVLNMLEEALTAMNIDKVQIRDMLESQLGSTQPHDWSVGEGEFATDEEGLLTGWITFETAFAVAMVWSESMRTRYGPC